MNNPNPDNQNQQQQGGQQDQGGQQGGQNNTGGHNASPVKVASSRAGRTSPDSKVDSAELNQRPGTSPGLCLMSGSLLGHLRGFRLQIDRAFRDLSQGRIGLLFFIESLFEKTDSVA